MKSELVAASTVLFLLLSAMPIHVGFAQNVELLSRGDAFTYERYHIWISNDPQADSDYNEDFFSRNNSIVTLRIDNVSSTTVGVHITIRYQNGSQIDESMIHDLVTGYNTANTVFGDPRGGSLTDLIQRPQERVDHNETRTYGQITRQVNVFFNKEYGWTMHYNTVHNVTISTKRCYDMETGLFLESDSETFVYNRYNPSLNQIIHAFFVLKDSNVWVAPKPPDQPNLILPFVVTIIVSVIVVAAAVVYLKKRKLPNVSVTKNP